MVALGFSGFALSLEHFNSSLICAIELTGNIRYKQRSMVPLMHFIVLHREKNRIKTNEIFSNIFCGKRDVIKHKMEQNWECVHWCDPGQTVKTLLNPINSNYI